MWRARALERKELKKIHVKWREREEGQREKGWKDIMKVLINLMHSLNIAFVNSNWLIV